MDKSGLTRVEIRSICTKYSDMYVDLQTYKRTMYVHVRKFERQDGPGRRYIWLMDDAAALEVEEEGERRVMTRYPSDEDPVGQKER